MCKACKSYEQQSDIIEKALSDWVRKKENSGDEKVLSNQAKAGLIDKLNSK
jgi:hypothetical protein